MKLRNINLKCWIHETRLVELIELQGGRSNLKRVVDIALKNKPSSFMCVKEDHGTKERFECALDNTNNSKTHMMNTPRWHLVGQERPTTGNFLSASVQKKMIKAMQGKGKMDKTTSQRRQNGWRDWADKEDNKCSRAFCKSDMPLIKKSCGKHFGDDVATNSFCVELRQMLHLSNIVDLVALTPGDVSAATISPESAVPASPMATTQEENMQIETVPETQIAAAPRNAARPVPVATVTDQRQRKQQRVSNATSSSEWSLANMSDVLTNNQQEFAQRELLIVTCYDDFGATEDHLKSLVRVKFERRCKRLPTQELVTDALLMSKPRLASILNRSIPGARRNCFVGQHVQPPDNELLIDFFAQMERFAAGERLPQPTHTTMPNGQKTLTGWASHILRHVSCACKIGTTRMPGLMNSIAPCFLGRGLLKDEFSSKSSIALHHARPHGMDQLCKKKDFEEHAMTRDTCGNMRLWHNCCNDSQHLEKTKQHASLHTARNSKGMPTWKSSTVGVAVSSDSDGNSEMNVDMFEEVLGTHALACFGGGTSDNAADAMLTQKKSFDLAMSRLIGTDWAGMRVANGAMHLPIVFGDPFHVANLVVMWASISAFGQTTRGKHEETHHRQLPQSVHDGFKGNKDIAKKDVEHLANLHGTEAPRVKAVRERQQRWMVNQRQCAHLLNLCNIDCGGKSFLLLCFARLARTLGTGCKADAIRHCGKLLAMPEIRTAMHFEAELGKCFQTVMSWHSRSGVLCNRPGFRMMETHQFFFEFELPFWKKAIMFPQEVFPNTHASLDDVQKTESGAKKEEQLHAGIESACNEMLKMGSQCFQPSHVFLMLLLGKQGPCFARAFLEESLVAINTDNQLNFLGPIDWPTFNAPSQLCADFCNIIGQERKLVVHFFRQLGLGKPVACSEIKSLAREQPSARTLLQFKTAHPAMCETLHSAHGLAPSASRLAEQLHGMLRDFLDKNKLTMSQEATDARQACIVDIECENRQHRRNQAHERRAEAHKESQGDNATCERPSKGCNHEASKAEQALIGEQVLRDAEKHEEWTLNKNFAKEELEPLKIRNLCKKGTAKKDKERASAQHERLQDKASRRRAPAMTYEDFADEADASTVENDEEWVDCEQQLLDNRRKEVAVKAFWQAQSPLVLRGLPLSAMFPGIVEPEKKTKGEIAKAIGEHLKQHANHALINLQAVHGLEREISSETAKRRKATSEFFKNSGSVDWDDHCS